MTLPMASAEKLTPPGSRQRVVQLHIQPTGPFVDPWCGNFSVYVGADQTWWHTKNRLSPSTGVPPGLQCLFIIRRWMWWPGSKCDDLTLADREIQAELFIEVSRMEDPE